MTATDPDERIVSLPTPPADMDDTTPGTALAAGGFAPEMCLMTPEGPVQVTELTPDDRVFALDPTTRVVKPKPVAAVETVPAPDTLVRLRTQRADLRLAPDHRVPYLTKATDRIRYQPIDALDKAYYKFVNEWRPRAGHALSTVDITDYLDTFEACAATTTHGHTFRAALPDGCDPCRRNSHVGYYFDSETFKRYQSAIETIAETVTVHAGPGHHRRPYRFDGTDFLKFLGWMITEGSIYWPADRDTAAIKIAQETTRHRTRIATLFDRLGLDVTVNDRRFEFGSVLFGRLLNRFCGTDSHTKRIPDLVWDASPRQRQQLLTVLLRGDGNARGTFYTTSDALATDVMRLCVGLGLKPRFTRRDDLWNIFIRTVNDGFSQAHLDRQRPAADEMYRLTLTDYHTVLAGHAGKYQWVGVSGVA